MLARRISRDVKERGRSVDGILEQYVSVHRAVPLLMVSAGISDTSSPHMTTSSSRLRVTPI